MDIWRACWVVLMWFIACFNCPLPVGVDMFYDLFYLYLQEELLQRMIKKVDILRDDKKELVVDIEENEALGKQVQCRIIQLHWLQFICRSLLLVCISPAVPNSLMWGYYPACLQKIDCSTRVIKLTMPIWAIKGLFLTTYTWSIHLQGEISLYFFNMGLRFHQKCPPRFFVLYK